MEKQARTPSMFPAGLPDKPMMSWATWPMELWLRWQSEVLKSTLPVAASWFERRCNGTDATLDALKRIGGCQDLRSVLDVQSEWVEAERQRLEADLEAVMSTTAILAAPSANGTGKAQPKTTAH